MPISGPKRSETQAFITASTSSAPESTEVAAAGLAQLRDQGWLEALPPTTALRVEVHTAPTVHTVPLKALQRWASSPSVSPKQELLKRPLR